MRLHRVLGAATVLAALLSQPSAAQEGRQFKDSWFWGVKAGGLLYSSPATDRSGAPLVGADWLITRSQGGLYVSFDQSFFTTQGSFADRDADSVFTRPVALKNLRRVTLAAMAFPMQSRDVHPYAGVGLALQQIASAAAQGNFASTTRLQIAADSVQSKKTAFTPILMAGVQARLASFSLFAQATGSPSQKGFFLYNGNSAFNLSLEAGVRYNVGTAISK